MRVSLNLDDVANRVAKPWSFVVVVTVMIVSRPSWRVPPAEMIKFISYLLRLYDTNWHPAPCKPYTFLQSFFFFFYYGFLVSFASWRKITDKGDKLVKLFISVVRVTLKSVNAMGV